MFFPSPSATLPPCLLLAHNDATFVADAMERFRRLGWDVYQAKDGCEVRQLVVFLQPQLIVLDVDLDDESGWLTCAKLTTERLAERVVLLSDDVGPYWQRLASFVGANALLPRRGGLSALMRGTWPAATCAVG